MTRIQKLLNNLPTETIYDTLNSPVGSLSILASSKGLRCILWEHEAITYDCISKLKQFQQNPTHPIIVKTKQQLEEYFSGKRNVFDVPFDLTGTPFQLNAWQILCQIPYGQTISYGEQAAKLGDKNKARAVGLANGLNPIPIIIPCHRVIGSNSQLTGFGGGVGNKKWLLRLEMSQHNKP